MDFERRYALEDTANRSIRADANHALARADITILSVAKLDVRNTPAGCASWTARIESEYLKFSEPSESPMP